MMYPARLFLWTLLSTLVVAVHAAEPKLIVAILVDQLRYDYLDAFRSISRRMAFAFSWITGCS